MPTFESRSHQIVSLTLIDHHVEALFYSLPGDKARRMEVFEEGSEPRTPDLLLNSHGLRLVGQWKGHATVDPFTRVGRVAIVDPVPYGPELVTRVSEHQDAFTALLDTYAAHGVPGRIQVAEADAALAAAGFWDWFAEAVRSHEWWPWETVDGSEIALLAAEAAYLHPDEDFRRDCFDLMRHARYAGQANENLWERIGAISYDASIECDINPRLWLQL
jgi:hypothetical protein